MAAAPLGRIMAPALPASSGWAADLSRGFRCGYGHPKPGTTGRGDGSVPHLAQWAAKQPDKPACVFPDTGEVQTYGVLHARADAAARWLAGAAARRGGVRDADGKPPGAVRIGLRRATRRALLRAAQRAPETAGTRLHAPRQRRAGDGREPGDDGAGGRGGRVAARRDRDPGRVRGRPGRSTRDGPGGPAGGAGPAVFVGHHGPAKGRAPRIASRRGAPRATAGAGHAGGGGVRRTHRLPVPRPAVSRRPAPLHAARHRAWRDRGGHPPVRCRPGAGADRTLPGDPRPVRADAFRAPARAAGSGAACGGLQQPAPGDPRGSALPGRGEGDDDRLVGAGDLRILLRLRDDRQHHDRERGLAAPQGLGRPRQRRRAAHHGGGRGGAAAGRGGLRPVLRNAPVRIPERAGKNRGGIRRERLGHLWRCRLGGRGRIPVPQ